MVVLKGIPVILSPELLYALAQMGHGDEIGEWVVVWRILWTFCDRSFGLCEAANCWEKRLQIGGSNLTSEVQIIIALIDTLGVCVYILCVYFLCML